MEKTVITWRRATNEEINNGSAEMIKVLEETITVDEAQEPPIDVVAILTNCTPEQINQIKALLL